MGSENLWEIVRFMKTNATVTPRQVKRLLGCDSRKSNDLLNYLLQRGVVTNIGKFRHPEFRLRADGEAKLTPLTTAKKAKRREKVKPASVVDECRKNWAGYQIHKIFGSAQV